MELDLKNKCRVCLGGDNEFYNIYDEFDQSLTLLDIFLDTTNFQINDDCEISPYLCKNCTSVIVDFYNLKIIYNENRNQMHQLLSSLENNEATNLNESSQINDIKNDETNEEETADDDGDNHHEADTIKVEIYSGSEEEMAENDKNLEINDKKEQITITCDSSSLEYYQQQVKNDEITKYILCPKCGETFRDETEIETHLISKHEISPEEIEQNQHVYIKDDPNSEFAVHSDNQKKNICDICGASFIKKSYLKDHKEIHETERRYICNYCNKAFKRRTVLVKHKRIHTHPRQCICEICGKAFNDKGTLKTHIMLLHVKLRNYDCMICGMKFPLKATLEKHIKRHQNKQREYYCQHCPLGYKDKSSLDRHIYIKHSGVNTKVACNDCGKQYSTVSNLLKHKRICHEINGQINSNNNSEEIDETTLL